jgi:hypothetical protein
MNITELNNFNLADAVRFHQSLNPGIWGRDERMLPEVRTKLLEIAADFQEFLGVSDLEVQDITISGSNAAYSYTPQSDIDLHLVVRKPEQHNDVYQELFNAKKYQYNDMHDIRVRGADVELYVQPADEAPVSLGEYSIMNDEWIQVPRRRRASIDHSVVKHKYEDLAARIENALKDDDSERIGALISKIKTMRQSGLDKHGEFGSENVAYKMLRAHGLIQKLYDAQAAARDRELSLNERRKKKKRVRYAYGGYWMPGFSFGDDQGGGDGGGGESVQEVSITPDGVNPSTKMFLEQESAQDVDILKSFAQYVSKELGLAKMPRIVIKRQPEWAEQNGSFGQYVPDLNQLTLSLHGRHIIDVLRTLAHELTHAHQQQTTGIPDNGGDTGSEFENEANARAGEFMRHFANAHPEYFDAKTLGESSGYIPTEAEKNDPRFVMALSPDVQPGATGKNANKMALKTDAQGRPALLMKTANLREGRMPQPSQGPGKYRDLNQPLGPETPPTMPAGTVRIDVSDMYDWYKLGQHISNMKGLGKHDFGAGPPSSVISFGDEETEHKFIKDLEATGLDVTDIDPKDPKQPAGMRKIKTDPTYNVDEDLVESLRQEFALLEDEYISEVKMSTANLRQLAAQTGALAGMEFEMIVPNTETDIEPEYEPDYDQDSRARSFSDVRDFFHDGDYNSRRDADRLIEEIDEEYQEWKQDQTAEAWARDGADYVRDYVANNDLFDRDEAMAQARDEIIDANPDLPQESEEFTELLSARLNEMETEFADTAFEDRGRIHDAAFEEFSEMQDDEYDERSFLDDKYPYMTDIQNNFDISWPYYYDINDGQDGDMDVDQVADEFSSYMGKPVNASRSYHGARREPGHYVVEPDGSLEGDNPGDGGLEFVSPPMPIDEMIADLNKVKTWAGKIGAYTNDSTGLHINISVPDYSLEKLDYVKLALLMGDEYVLELFGRSGNTYAKAATGKIRDALRKNPDLAPVMMDKMRDHMEDLATKAIHSGTTDKYTSINTKSGYIEFRSPGGDWLDENFDKIENTLLRFTVALSAAIDPEAYRQEYLKKLYKLLESSQEKGGVDVVQLFSNYSAGELDKAALIRQVREKQLARNVEKGKVTGKMWWKVARPGYFASVEVVAASKQEAIEKGKAEYPDWRDARDITATPLRPYQEPQTPEAAGPTLNGRPSNPDGRWIIIDRRDRDTPVYRYAAADSNDAFNVLRQWIAANPGGEWMYAQDPTQRLGQPQAQQPAASTDQGNWGIWITNADRFANQPGSYSRNETPPPRRFPSQEAAEQWIEQQRATRPNMRSDIEIREIPADSATTAPAVNRNTLAPTGPGPWEVFRRSDGSSVAELGQTNRMAAEVEARRVIDQRREAPELYGVRTANTTPDNQQPTAPQTLTRPGRGQQTFTGEWKIVDANDRELHRFGGIGNVQSDANRVAMDWLRRNSQYMQSGVQVLPVMG